MGCECLQLTGLAVAAALSEEPQQDVAVSPSAPTPYVAAPKPPNLSIPPGYLYGVVALAGRGGMSSYKVQWHFLTIN